MGCMAANGTTSLLFTGDVAADARIRMNSEAYRAVLAAPREMLRHIADG